ncbi:hypothetical protein PQQ99_09705 [Paraburkholderia sediminicola]|uniref:hypothetical protein n=1 Tax=Paraburkholderia sediminicola TaxID=458836 RepID=UPI0038BBC0A1
MNVLGIAPAIWFPVITLIVGAILKAAFDILTDRRTARHAREVRKEQRLETVSLRRTDFQRATLLELQEAIQQLARFTGKSNHQDVVAYRTSGKWQKQMLDNDTDEGSLKAQTSVSKLRVRVRDAEIRKLSKDFSASCTNAVLATSEVAADDALIRMSEILSELHEKIGVALRSLDDDDDQAIETQS